MRRLRLLSLLGLLALALQPLAAAGEPLATASAAPPQPGPELSAEQANRTTDSAAAVAEFIAAFDESYRIPTHEQESLNAAEATLTAAERALQPRATFKEQLAWNDYAALALELGVGVELPLFSSTAPLAVELAGLDLATRRMAVNASRSEARATLLMDLANLWALHWALALSAEALAAIDRLEVSWLVDARSAEGYVPPASRDAFEQYLNLLDANTWFADQVAALERNLGEGPLGATDSSELPSIDAIDAYLEENSPPPHGRPPQCRTAAPQALQAELRSKADTLHDSLQRQTEYTVALNAEVDYAFSPWPTSGASASSGAPFGGAARASAGPAVAISLEARLPLPDRWPLAGSATFSVSPERVEQGLSLAWPPVPFPEIVPIDREAELRKDLANLRSNLVLLEKAYRESVNVRELAERRFTWELIDLAPSLSPGSISGLVAEALSQPDLEVLPPSVADGPAALQRALVLVELRIQHMFARVAETSSLVRYLDACGEL